MFPLHNRVLLWSFYTTFLISYPIGIIYINTIELRSIIRSKSLNGFVKLIFNMDYEVLNKFSGFGLGLHKKNPSVPRMIIYHSKEVFMAMNGRDANGSPYIKMNKIKTRIRNCITFAERQFMLFRQMANITNIRTFRLNIRKGFTNMFCNSTGRVPKPIMPSINVTFSTIQHITWREIRILSNREAIKVV